MDLVTRVVPPPTLEETSTKARAALGHAASRRRHDDAGHDAERDELRAYQSLRARGELPVRITSHQNRDVDSLVAAGVDDADSATTGCASAGSSSSRTARWDRARRRSSSPTPTIRRRRGC